jgi:hypothetical protein
VSPRPFLHHEHEPSTAGAATRKLADLDEQIAKARTAKEALTHALHSPHDDITTCPRFTSTVAARLDGQALEEAHPH